MHREYSVVLIKPDAIQKGLIGEIISRFEKIGLNLIACKLVMIDEEMALKHYGGGNSQWFEDVGQKLIKFYKEHGKDPQEEVGTLKAKQIGKIVQKWNVDYLKEGSLLAMIWQGPHAIEVIRKITGHTYPQLATPGTIRGDYSFESPLLANSRNRAIHNLIHASGSVEEAKFERQLWFKENEIFGIN
ncbi:nucleoside-diphosphate kinase [Candidatus Shapirobacteria bacterium]|nr:nucleoside-diphosphate kinase [Candidatus Shapirobacteria bacterium]